MTRFRRPVAVAALAIAALSGSIGEADAAPPWLEGLRNYRVVDASGRVEYRPDPDASGRIAYRPTTAPSILLRGRPNVINNYAGSIYGRRVRPAPLEPTGFWAGKPKKPCGHSGPCVHGR